MKIREYNQLVVGLGEVGSAIQNILCCEGYDLKHGDNRDTLSAYYDILHICFPYSVDFIDHVEQYKKIFSPRIIVVHSSVPIGTCAKIGAVHSPVRGVHPYLEEGIRTFCKYFGGPKSYEVARIFGSKGIITKVISDSRTTEALKLWDTTQYGVMILLEKEIYEFCRKNNLDFQVVYAAANESYNQGYEELNMPYVRRPILEHYEGKIGGHCVIPNAKLFESESAKRILDHAGSEPDMIVHGIPVFVTKTKSERAKYKRKGKK